MMEGAAMGKHTEAPKARKSRKVEDLSVKEPKDIVGGGTSKGTSKGTASPQPTESVSLNFTKVEYR